MKHYVYFVALVILSGAALGTVSSLAANALVKLWKFLASSPK